MTHSKMVFTRDEGDCRTTLAAVSMLTRKPVGTVEEKVAAIKEAVTPPLLPSTSMFGSRTLLETKSTPGRPIYMAAKASKTDECYVRGRYDDLPRSWRLPLLIGRRNVPW